ncbi:hypothetical protein G7074_02940 [Pedobacter sp. HDW13]|uniref:hypothetical protein n=1 Tax=Pedobacter sp. HDW13 TaxID=2714940 RepID=UPI0014081359|nr:hypothetical protein [Pedobacter sp. HDW13]QIL38325.1 hypothetical protein G7074_02940 [Pedobacter sp. HDW13]
MIKKYLLDATATLPNGELVVGPIVTANDTEYLFVNKYSDLDFYLTMQKNQNGWYQSGGPNIIHPQSMVDELGLQIDKFLIENPALSKTNLKDNND